MLGNQQTCRGQFTPGDFQFVSQALATPGGQEAKLLELLESEAERDLVLDDEQLYAAVIDETGFLGISAAFYFYVLTRRCLKRAGLQDREVADYVATVLLSACRTESFTCGAGAGAAGSRQLVYLSDVLLKIQKAGPAEAYRLRNQVADYALFLSGILLERVRAQAERRGAPGIGYYEAIGQSSYQAVAAHPVTRSSRMQVVFLILAEEFTRIRMALNTLATSVMHFHGDIPGLSGA